MSGYDAAAVIRRHRRPAVLGGALAVAAVAEITLPLAGADLVFGAVASAGVAAMIVGPVVRRPVPPGPFRWLTATGLVFLVAEVLRMTLPAGDGLSAGDVTALAGYACQLTFLASLLRCAQGRLDLLALDDAMLVTLAGAQVLWSVEVGPQLLGHHGQIGRSPAFAAFPLFDVATMALVAALATGAARRGPALWALLIGSCSLLAGDLLFGALEVTHGSSSDRVVQVFHMVAFALVGVVAAHPSASQLAEPGHTRRRPRRLSAVRKLTVTAVVVVSGGVTLLMPTVNWQDRLVRGLLLVVLLVVVESRLVGTVDALGRAEEVSRHQALHDALTDLPNRTAMHLDVECRLAADPAAGWVSVLCLDGDRFQQVNDTWGHAVGDELLRAFAARLQGVVGETGAAFRISGDEFVVVSSDADADAGMDLARRIIAESGEPLQLREGRSVVLTATVGVAQSRPGATEAAELVRDADTALYRAKRDGASSLTRFDDSLRTQVYDRLLLAEDLRRAVRDGQLEVHFQPIRVGAGFADLAGFEALARWTHPERGPVPPGVFIPIAEDTGSIIEIGEFVMRRACFQLAAWRARTGADLHVSVNVSQAQIARTDVEAMVASAVRDAGLPPESVWVEITESMLAEQGDRVIGTLRRLKDLGVVLALDDFGTGYSSLSCLGDFPIDVVKVDRSFVSRLGEDERTTALTRAIIDMSRCLGLTGVVAEGVETSEQASYLVGMGCTWVQGWLYGRPQASADIELPGRRLPGSPVEPVADQV